MAGPYGVVPEGFNPKPLQDIKTDLEAAYRAVFGAGVDVSASSPFGQEIGIMAERLAELWSVGEAAYGSAFPDSATGASLDLVAALGGVTRIPAAYSTVSVTLAGTATAVPSGTVVSNGLGVRWATTALATKVALTAWATSTGYSTGDRRTANGNAYLATASGTSAGAGTGPSGTGTAITDGTVVWAYIGTGTAVVDANAQAENIGPVSGIARSINTIETPVSGLSSALNILDAQVGRVEETDAELRVRREIAIRAIGGATVDAIRSNVLSVSGVTDCYLFENDSDITDVNGLPPHTFEAVAAGGTDLAVATAIFDKKAAGIGTYGTTTQPVTDDQAQVHQIKFSRPSVVNVWVVLTVKVDFGTFPLDGSDQVKAALVAYQEANLRVGIDVRSAALVSTIFAIPGVLDLGGLPFIGTAPSPVTSATIVLTNRQIADFDTSRITVAVVEGSL